MPVPTEIRIRRAARTLDVTYDDGAHVSLPAEYLRVESPSAEVQGHAPSERKLVSGKQDVNIETVDAIGNYAIRIRFSDGHDTGIYSWTFLRQLAAEYEPRWQAYLEELTAQARTRTA
jgi:DUF971 family protein